MMLWLPGREPTDPGNRATNLDCTCTSLSLWRGLSSRGGQELCHVRAHVGNAWNELADTVAKAAARGTFGPIGPTQEGLSFLQADLRWLSTAVHFVGQSSLPLAGGDRLPWNERSDAACTPLTAKQLIPIQAQWPNGTGRNCELQLKVATINIQGMSGKHAYLEQQFEDEGLHIVFVQETKEGGGQCRSKRFFRVASDALSHWGVGVWINAQLGLLTRDAKPCRVDEDDVHVVHNLERLLVLSIKLADFHCVLFSGHCPHTGKQADSKRFLVDLERVLLPYRDAGLLLGGLDLNGRPPLDVPDVTGGVACGDPDQTGAQAVKVLERLGCWLPSTFETAHVGPNETYCRHQT